MAKSLNLTELKYGRLRVVHRTESVRTKSGTLITMWHCICDCGKETNVSTGNLRSGHTISCGCLGSRATVGKRSITHNKSYCGLYSVWSGIKRRCYNPHEEGYHKYGGRGISMCDDWKNDFQSFYEWAIGHGYNKSLSIDRIDNNGNYCPENCRWTTAKEQSYNRRNTIYLEFLGETKNLWEWEQETGIPASRIDDRLRKGWSVARALTQPLRRLA